MVQIFFKPKYILQNIIKDSPKWLTLDTPNF